MAHAGGIDEMAFVLLPVVVFLVLSWLSRRKQRAAVGSGSEEDAEQENGGRGPNVT